MLEIAHAMQEYNKLDLVDWRTCGDVAILSVIYNFCLLNL